MTSQTTTEIERIAMSTIRPGAGNIRLLVPRDKEDGWRHIQSACKHHQIEFVDYDIYAADWIEQAKGAQIDGCIYRPEFRYSSWRQLFSERIGFLHTSLGIPVYPSLNELSLYESKRRMSYWLAANNVAHPATFVFCDQAEAESFLTTTTFPLVHKTDFGNCGQGVRVLRSRAQALDIVRAAFSAGYAIPSFDPNELDVWRRLKHLTRPLFRKLLGMRHFPPDKDIDVVLFQEFVDICAEWRVVKLGELFFGHDKLPNAKGLRSGGGETSWTIPSRRVFEFAKQVCAIGGFNSMALDIFEDSSGRLFVNELQTVFGVVAKNQMYRLSPSGKVGLGLRQDDASGEWIEELGEFGQDYCYRLRVADFARHLCPQ